MMLVPGFSLPASAWDAVLAALHPSIDATALDVPDDLDFAGTAAELGARGGPAVYVGYSMGGRLVLQLALDRPDLVTGLVVVSASPGIADPAVRRERADADASLAREIERDGVEAFLDRWVEQPLFAGLSRGDAAVDDRVASMSVARLAHQLTGLGQGAMPDGWARLEELAMPTLLLTGARDAKYGKVAAEMHRRNRRFERRVIAGGHALPLEHPGVVAEQLNTFVHERCSGAE